LPVVVVEWWEGRTPEQKEKLITGITKVFADMGGKPEDLHIIIHDVPKPVGAQRENKPPKCEDINPTKPGNSTNCMHGKGITLLSAMLSSKR
jgi:4-oxalocrotonate tautomerase family enzyme